MPTSWVFAALGAIGVVIGYVIGGGVTAAVLVVMAFGAVYGVAFHRMSDFWERWFSRRQR